MTHVSHPEIPGSSTRPYLIRALHDWCTDNGFTPYLAVHVDRTVQVPMEYVKNNEIVLNVGFEATSGLKLGNDFIEFRARFGGVARDILVPVDHVVAIYARENGQGMAFPLPSPGEGEAHGAAAQTPTVVDASAPRGLRLAPAAGTTAPVEPDERDESLVDNDETDPPDGPKPPGTPRPALKRVK